MIDSLLSLLLQQLRQLAPTSLQLQLRLRAIPSPGQPFNASGFRLAFDSFLASSAVRHEVSIAEARRPKANGIAD